MNRNSQPSGTDRIRNTSVPSSYRLDITIALCRNMGVKRSDAAGGRAV